MSHRHRTHKRPKVQRAYLERRLYKTERKIERLSAGANALRRLIRMIDEQTLKRKQAALESKELLEAGVTAANQLKKEDTNASHREERT